MGLLALVRTKQYRNFMAKLYGWGAAVVIIGALFKINHYTGADIMLIIGLGTESIIFFFSAFEPPHVEPDWSLVYPQLAGMYHNEDIDANKAITRGETVTQELDKMLEKAKIGPELIQSLGDGIRTLTDTTSKISSVANVSVANDQYIHTLHTATESAGQLTDTYRKTARTLEQGATASEEHFKHIQASAKSAATLSSMFTEVSESLKDDIHANKAFSSSIANATASANHFVEKYNESAALLSKTAESLTTSASEGTNYNKQLQRISSNLSALNALYELHLQGSNEQMETSAKFNTVLSKFATNLNDSMANTVKFKEEVDNLTKNIVALNKVYGNMLSAMNITNK